MAIIKLFDPDVGAFASKTASSISNQGSVPLLLLNILIELRVHTQYLASMNPQAIDNLSDLRTDEITEGSS